mmetsp:Transcript_84675/g.220447  ORF Transcript_84675/g.220447 Transcript_84675/m.220447 type:complete len:397 (+) Transcript_84675:645-1835(+)
MPAHTSAGAMNACPGHKQPPPLHAQRPPRPCGPWPLLRPCEPAIPGPPTLQLRPPCAALPPTVAGYRGHLARRRDGSQMWTPTLLRALWVEHSPRPMMLCQQLKSSAGSHFAAGAMSCPSLNLSLMMCYPFHVALEVMASRPPPCRLAAACLLPQRPLSLWNQSPHRHWRHCCHHSGMGAPSSWWAPVKSGHQPGVVHEQQVAAAPPEDPPGARRQEAPPPAAAMPAATAIHQPQLPHGRPPIAPRRPRNRHWARRPPSPTTTPGPLPPLLPQPRSAPLPLPLQPPARQRCAGLPWRPASQPQLGPPTELPPRQLNCGGGRRLRRQPSPAGRWPRRPLASPGRRCCAKAPAHAAGLGCQRYLRARTRHRPAWRPRRPRQQSGERQTRAIERRCRRS